MLSAVVKFCTPNSKDGINGINENRSSMGRGHLLNLEVNPDALSLLVGFYYLKKIYLFDLESPSKTSPWLRWMFDLSSDVLFFFFLN